ncbi:hypothetical protein EVAR_89643_1 [Eumeta japonica]|uniref:Uncharacterized protein n=1 Tax=Eumeta variegata TaxID=151549 RepID=A0A4C1Z521_EUMVA|nr:hypothetical protein EVAR_89643_1 [Eumeta japonica]
MKLVTKASHWRKIGSLGHIRKGRGVLNLRITSIAGSSERQSFVSVGCYEVGRGNTPACNPRSPVAWCDDMSETVTCSQLTSHQLSYLNQTIQKSNVSRKGRQSERTDNIIPDDHRVNEARGVCG